MLFGKKPLVSPSSRPNVQDTIVDSATTTTAPISDPLIEFTLFPKLPIKIRLKIWKAASFAPRNVDLWCYLKHALGHSADWCDERYKFSSFTRPPAVLNVFQESRNECLKFYKVENHPAQSDREVRLHTAIELAP